MPKSRFGRRISDLVFYGSLLAAVLLAGWLGARHSRQWDWTAERKNSLSRASLQVLARLDAPLTITSFTPPERRLRRPIERFLQRYRQASPWVSISFLDPELHPERTRSARVTLTGEMLLAYGERHETVKTLSEGSITDAIQRLLARDAPWIVALAGHGERDISGRANHDLGDFARTLTQKGFRAHSLTLATTPAVPANTRLLMLAGPQIDLLPEETARLIDFLEQGGNLLWLLDPETLGGLEPLAAYLGVQPLPGIVVDANAGELGLDDPTVALVPKYPAHAVTRDFQGLTLFPRSLALSVRDGTAWKATPLLSTLEHSWNETGPLHGTIAREPQQGEQAGPLHLGWALTRESAAATEQRVVVIGDGDFLANRYLGNAGNLDFGLRLVRWLAAQDKLVEIPARLAPDRELRLTSTQILIIGVGSLIGAPTTFLGIGLLVWWRRHRD